MKYLTTGEFAKFCGTSKDTLIFYDRQNLLKPRHVSENGYRRYEPEQFYDFDFISMLKETGSSLTEIREQLQTRSPERILALLEEKAPVLKRESERLARRRAALEEMRLVIAEAAQIRYDVLSFEELAEERLELTPAALETDFDMDTDDSFLAQYRAYVACDDMPQPMLRGVMISGQSLAAGRYAASCFFHRAHGAIPRRKLHRFAAGRYAVLAHKGNTASHIKAYRGMLAEMERAALTVHAPMYIYDLMSYVIIPDPEEYAVKYCVRVE